MTLGGLLINRRTHEKYRLDGCRRSRVKPLLKLARPFLSALNRQQLPNVVDLRSHLSPIEQQYSIGSCVGNALASILEYFYFYTTGHVKRFSRLFIYYNARMLEDEISKRHATKTDSGADIQFAIIGLIKYGCCDEQFWPFAEHLINVQPSPEAYQNGQNYRLNEFRRLSNNVKQLRECLAEGYPFIMAIKIFPSFGLNHQGLIPMPSKHEKSSHYRHAIVCVGYIHSKRVFIIRNSHGLHWGDHGYGYLPYDYVTDKVLTKDLWAILSIKNMSTIPIEKHIAWDNSPMLLRSMSQFNLNDDQSNWDIQYQNNDYETDESETSDSYQRNHSLERYTEHAASPALHHDQSFMQPPLSSPFLNNSPFVYAPPPMVFMNPSFMQPFPYYPAMFGSRPF